MLQPGLAQSQTQIHLSHSSFLLLCLLNCLSRLNSWMWIKQTTWTFSQTGLLALPLTNTTLSEHEPETQRKGNNCKGQEGNRSFAKGQHENTFLLLGQSLEILPDSPFPPAHFHTAITPTPAKPAGLGLEERYCQEAAPQGVIYYLHT